MEVWVLINSENRPCGVTTSEAAANAFADDNNVNDIIPFILDDLSLTGMTEHKKVHPPSSVQDTLNKVEETSKGLDETQKNLQKILDSRKKKKLTSRLLSTNLGLSKLRRRSSMSGLKSE